MDKEVLERFERTERHMERVTEMQKDLQAGHMELEAAQRNLVMMLTHFFDQTNAKLTRLSVLVEDLVKQNMETH